MADLFSFIQIKGLLSASPAYPPEKEEGERKRKVAQANAGEESKWQLQRQKRCAANLTDVLAAEKSCPYDLGERVPAALRTSYRSGKDRNKQLGCFCSTVRKYVACYTAPIGAEPPLWVTV